MLFYRIKGFEDAYGFYYLYTFVANRILYISFCMRKFIILLFFSISASIPLFGQINTERVLAIGRNALYFEDYVLSIQYFNQVIKVKPYMAEPYFYRAIAKISLDDYQGALEDASLCIERNPFIVNAYQIRGIARQNMDLYDGAIEDYQKGLLYAPENKTFLLNMAIAYAQKKDYDNSAVAFENLIKIHPSYYNAYMSRSALMIERGDTVAAIKDIDKAITLDKYTSYAYAQRGMIKAAQSDYKPALDDMNEAIRLSPDMTAYYINRGLVRYHLNDLRGTMSDYDRVLELDKNNLIAYYNRGLLRAQVGDRNRAIDDFSNVIRLEPDNNFAFYNRAILRDETGDYRGAVADYSEVLKEYPRFLPALYARSESKRKMNAMKEAEADFMAAYKLEKELMAEREAKKKNPQIAENANKEEEEVSEDEKVRKESDKNIQKFNKILVADNDNGKSRYDSEIRGRVQDKNVAADLEASFILSYYEKGEQIRQSVYFEKSISDFNRAALLAKRLKPTNSEAPLTTDQITEHFASIDGFSKRIDSSPNNPLPYFARSLDFMLVQDFQSSIDDLNRTLALRDDFVLGYFNRAAIRMKQLETTSGKAENAGLNEEAPSKLNLSLIKETAKGKKDAVLPGLNEGLNLRKLEFEMVMRDYDKVLELDPGFVYAYFNRANVHCIQKDYKSALTDLDKAIALDSEFAEAYFNRGLVYIYLGQTAKGIADLSKSGELGMIGAYNLIKRVSE